VERHPPATDGSSTQTSTTDPATVSLSPRKDRIREHFDRLASKRAQWRRRYGYYYRLVERYFQFLIPPDASVLEIGCGTGDLLASLQPKRGVGIDLSPQMVATAGRQFPHLEFRVDDLESLRTDEAFDYVIVSNVLGYADDVQQAIGRLHQVCRPDTRIIVTYINYLWAPLFKAAEASGLRMAQPEMHWLPLEEIENLLKLNDFEVVRKTYRILMPFYVPLLSGFFNRVVVNLPVFWKLSLDEVVVARPVAKRQSPEQVTVSVIIPCRNERGNIDGAVRRLPSLGAHTEVIFVEGHSRDGTLEECHRVKAAYPERTISVLVQDGMGKGDAVRRGFAEAQGDVLMILDADLSVPPEELTKFFEAIVEGKGEFINGSRMVYPMERGAMRFLNYLGNKFFSRAFTYVLEQRLRDTLCGTKVLWREDYEKIAAGRAYFGEFDPFGDFDLLFGAAKLNLKIVEIPIHYRDRTYGTTQISRFRHGWLLLKMTVYAMRRIKCI
jgi:SAM-dependent methyltransferase